MSDSIGDLQLFTQIVAAGSLTRAAQRLDSSPPAVSRRLAAMESRLGVKLIERNARRFQLTEEGGALHERALRILADVVEAETEASSRSTHLRGRLRVGALLQFGRQRLAPLVARFGELHPDLQIELVLSDARMDLFDDDLDLLLQIEAPGPMASVVARPLLASRRVICASPAYLDRRGRPQHPDDLHEHDCLCVLRGRHVLRQWQVVVDGQPVAVQVSPRLCCSSGEVIHNWVLAGHGIGLKLRWDIEEDLTAGRLEECLADYNNEAVTLYAVYPPRRYPPPKLRAFLAFLTEALQALDAAGLRCRPVP